MASIEQALADCLAYARDDAHGYELGYHSSSTMGTGTDCSGLVRLYAAKLAGVGVNSYPDFSTRTERKVLTGRGWQAIAFSLAKARRGDVLLTETNGHTVIYLGGSRILGAEGDWDGVRGDSGGREVCERSYYDYDYNWILRPPAGAAGEEDEVTDADIEKIARKVWETGLGSLTADRVYRCTSILKAMAGIGPEDMSDPKGRASEISTLTIGRWERSLRILKGMVGIDQEDVSSDGIGTPMSVTLSDEQMASIADMVVARINGSSNAAGQGAEK